jgi:hypothetical protein
MSEMGQCPKCGEIAFGRAPRGHVCTTGAVWDRITCQALDGDAIRCRRQATHWDAYHGNQELYGYGNEGPPHWVKVYLCDEHRLHDKPKPKRRNAREVKP